MSHFDYFAAATQAAALNLIGADGAAPDVEVVSTSWADPLVALGDLVELIAGADARAEMIEQSLVLPDGGDETDSGVGDRAADGPFLELISRRAHEALANAEDAALSDVAAAWESRMADSAFEEEDFAPLTRQLVDLARQALRSEQRLYCWWGG